MLKKLTNKTNNQKRILTERQAMSPCDFYCDVACGGVTDVYFTAHFNLYFIYR